MIPVILIALGGLLFGGTVSLWKVNKLLSVALAVCAVLAVGAGLLRF